MKQIARKIIFLDDRDLDKKLAKEMIHPYNFTAENMKKGSSINLDNYKFIHANSILCLIPYYQDFAIEIRHDNRIINEMATFYVRLVNQYKYKYHIMVSAMFFRINEEDERSDEIELVTNLINTIELTETDNINIDV